MSEPPQRGEIEESRHEGRSHIVSYKRQFIGKTGFVEPTEEEPWLKIGI